MWSKCKTVNEVVRLVQTGNRNIFVVFRKKVTLSCDEICMDENISIMASVTIPGLMAGNQNVSF